LTAEFPLVPNHRDALTASRILLATKGRPEQSDEAYRAVVGLYEGLSRVSPGNPEYEEELNRLRAARDSWLREKGQPLR
jgi:hypothetical protein